MEENVVKSGKAARAIRKFILRLLCFLLTTVLLLCAFLYGVMFILCKGPSETARNLFVRSVRETSAIGFLASIYLSDEEIAQIESASDSFELESTDISLITVNTEKAEGPVTDEWGYTDEDNDGLILVPVAGGSFTGQMLIVLDPSRVILGCDTSVMGTEGRTVEEFAVMYDAVAAINGGGFADDNGMGNGGMPNTAVVQYGKTYFGGQGVGDGFVGIDSNYVLHVGISSTKDVEELGIQHGVGFGPVLVVNGKPNDPENLESGLNPRTAIGQRPDGAILLLVVDGRQAASLGATYGDIADLMLEFGAVNACNLDGGSSTLMWYKGEYINNCASVIGIRDIPTSFVVLKEGANG